jgi:hypothetical protein
MKKIALITAFAASFAAPAFAQTALEAAILNQNGSADSVSDRVSVAAEDVTMGVVVSTRNGSALSQAIAVYNASADRPSDRIDPTSVTVFSGTPGHGADIFARLAEESREND